MSKQLRKPEGKWFGPLWVDIEADAAGDLRVLIENDAKDNWLGGDDARAAAAYMVKCADWIEQKGGG